MDKIENGEYRRFLFLKIFSPLKRRSMLFFTERKASKELRTHSANRKLVYTLLYFYIYFPFYSTLFFKKRGNPVRSFVRPAAVR